MCTSEKASDAFLASAVCVVSMRLCMWRPQSHKSNAKKKKNINRSGESNNGQLNKIGLTESRWTI